MQSIRNKISLPRGTTCCHLCGGTPVTVVVVAKIGTACLDEPCVARIMGLAYDGGPQKKEQHDENRETGQARGVLASRSAIAAPPKPSDLTSAIRAYIPGLSGERERASTRIVDGGTKLGHIIAWRAWRWDRGQLRGAGIREVWVERQAPEAICYPTKDTPSHGHKHKAGAKVPMWLCACGYHALKPGPFKDFLRVAMQADWKGTRVIIGTVALWGRVVTHQDGYRAQFAYPIQCFAELRDGKLRPVPWQTTQALKRRYGVLIGSPEEAAGLLQTKPVFQ